MDWIEIVISAIPDFFGSVVDIVVTATPYLGQHSFHIFMVTGSLFFVLIVWLYDYA